MIGIETGSLEPFSSIIGSVVRAVFDLNHINRADSFCHIGAPLFSEMVVEGIGQATSTVGQDDPMHVQTIVG